MDDIELLPVMFGQFLIFVFSRLKWHHLVQNGLVGKTNFRMAKLSSSEPLMALASFPKIKSTLINFPEIFLRIKIVVNDFQMNFKE